MNGLRKQSVTRRRIVVARELSTILRTAYNASAIGARRLPGLSRARLRLFGAVGGGASAQRMGIASGHRRRLDRHT